MNFYVGLHQPSDAKHFDRCMVSVSRLRDRVSDFQVNEWMLDSGAFMELKLHGRYRDSVATYAAQIRRWSRCGRLVAAVGQDYMCEPFMLERTGLTVETHQRLTIERYDSLQLLAADTGVYILPVLQGYAPADYATHLVQYGARLSHGAWVGVGSVCKRNGDPSAIRDVLYTIAKARPDLRLHGFGVKRTALSSALVRDYLYSADSMAWSYAARREGRDANDYREAERYSRKVAGHYDDLPMFQDVT